MFAAVCWTPFQIMNVLNFKYNFAQGEEADLYVCNKFYGAEKVAQRLDKCGEFAHVYLVDNIDYDTVTGLKKQAAIVSGLFFPKKTITRYVRGEFKIAEKKYDYTVSSGYLNFNVIFTTYFRKRNPKLRCVFLDDGIESYLDKNTEDTYSSVYRMVSRLTGIGGAAMRVEKLYVYLPELVAAKEKYREVSTLPPKKSPELKARMKDIFQYEVGSYGQNYRVIYFDQLSTGDFHNENLIRLQEKILGIISARWDSSQWMIKMHPRAVKDLYPDQSHKLVSSIPWELFCDDLVDENTVLIAVSSTACITPKMIYGKEPKVFLLEKIFINDRERKVCDFFERVKETYSSEKSFFIPESVDEFQDMVMKLEV